MQSFVVPFGDGLIVVYAALVLGFGAFLAGTAAAALGRRQRDLAFGLGVLLFLAGLALTAWIAVGRVGIALKRSSPTGLFDFLGAHPLAAAALFAGGVLLLPAAVRPFAGGACAPWRRTAAVLFLVLFTSYGSAWTIHAVVASTAPEMLTVKANRTIPP